jgi:hypothetical protein
MRKIYGFLEIALLDPLGGKTQIKKIPFDSFLKQFMQIISANWSATTRSVLDTSNAAQNVLSSSYFSAVGPAANVNYGILVGTGTDAVDVSNYKLQTKILNGSGAGQLLYQGTVVSDVTVSGQNAYITIARNFNNNTANTITVEEVGIAIIYTVGGYYFQVSRDLTGGYAIPASKTGVITYTFQTSA